VCRCRSIFSNGWSLVSPDVLAVFEQGAFRPSYFEEAGQ
jgi:hypothetical protein